MSAPPIDVWPHSRQCRNADAHYWRKQLRAAYPARHKGRSQFGWARHCARMMRAFYPRESNP